jgi:preprotein translocase subunit Sec61beta
MERDEWNGHMACALAIALAFIWGPLHAQASPSSDVTKKRMDVIKFGIDTEVMDILGQLEKEKDDSFNEELLSLFKASKNLKLRQAVLDFYSRREWKGAEDAAAGIVGKWETEEEKLSIACIQYGIAIKSKAVLEAGRGYSMRNLPPFFSRWSGSPASQADHPNG